jgi:hypothetical protein
MAWLGRLTVVPALLQVTLTPRKWPSSLISGPQQWTNLFAVPGLIGYRESRTLQSFVTMQHHPSQFAIKSNN